MVLLNGDFRPSPKRTEIPTKNEADQEIAENLPEGLSTSIFLTITLGNTTSMDPAMIPVECKVSTSMKDPFNRYLDDIKLNHTFSVDLGKLNKSTVRDILLDIMSELTVKLDSYFVKKI